jgi:hypothetical protein
MVVKIALERDPELRKLALLMGTDDEAKAPLPTATTEPR